MKRLLKEISACTICQEHLPYPPKPVMSASPNSRIIIIGQAPGSRVQETGIPWDDPSGKLLRKWLQVDDAVFYDPQFFALLPMGFCYPGKGKSGDIAPRKECAPQWHNQVINKISTKPLTLLIGQYSQAYYLGKKGKKNLTETVRHCESYLPEHFPLPHPSPRNRFWMTKNKWFEQETLPLLRSIVAPLLTPQ